MEVFACSAESARAEEASARQQADQRAQQAAFQHAEELQKSRVALAALQKIVDLKEQTCQAAAVHSQAQVVKMMEDNARANDAEQARLSAVSNAEQHFLHAKQANDRANSFEQQAKHAQLAAQQKASRVGELERLVEQLMQQVVQLLPSHQALANHIGILCLHTAFLNVFRHDLHDRCPCWS